MTFSEYYKTKFREDFQLFALSIPEKERHHNRDEREVTIQSDKLLRSNPYLKAVPVTDQSRFLVAVYFTVLVDQVCYTYYRDRYGEFRSLTMYPKFTGDCPGGCGYHRHPVDILLIASYRRRGFIADAEIDASIKYTFVDAIDTMRDEVHDFFAQHMSGIDSEEFWQKCADEFPAGVVGRV